MKEKLVNILKVAISLGLMAFLFSRPEMSQTGRIIASANLLYFAAAIVVYVLAILVNVYKWQLLLHAQKVEASFGDLASYFFTGLFFANFLLPMVAGDVVRGYGLARDSAQAAEAAISVLVDRLIGLASFLFAAVLSLGFAVFVLGRSDLAWIAWLTCGVGVAFVLLFASMLSRRLRAMMEKLFQFRFLKRLAPLYIKLSTALDAYRGNIASLFLAFAIALVGLLLTNVVNFWSAEAVKAGIPLIYIFIFNPLTPFAPLLIPSVGGLGVNQGTFVLLYSTIGRVTSPANAFSFSLIMQLIIYLTSLPGAFLWWKSR